MDADYPTKGVNIPRRSTVFLALSGESAIEIRQHIANRFGYDLDTTVDAIRPLYDLDVSSLGTVPPAIICALDARDFEDAIRNAVSLGGDADTLACFSGGIAEVLYGIPQPISQEGKSRLPTELLEVIRRFDSKFGSRDMVVE